MPSFFEALAEAYKKKSFYNIQKARVANGYTDDGYPGKIPRFINQDIAKIQERRNYPDRDDETSSSGPGSKGEGKSLRQIGLQDITLTNLQLMLQIAGNDKSRPLVQCTKKIFHLSQKNRRESLRKQR